MPETRATRYVGHGRWECLHGLLIQQCRCMHPEFTTSPKIGRCEDVPAHGAQRIEELRAAEEAERAQYPVFVMEYGPPMRVYPAHYSWKELNLIEDALIYFKLSLGQMGIEPDDPDEWHPDDCVPLLDKVTKLREAAAEVEHEEAPF